MISIRNLSLFALFAVLLLAVEGRKQRPVLSSAVKAVAQRQNLAMLKKVQSSAQKFNGKYYIQNAATRGFLFWHTSPQSIYASKTEKGKMTLSGYGAGTRINPTDSNNKCMAAQFSRDIGADHAATMYGCTTFATLHVDAGDPQAKQQWHFVPVAGKDNTYNIVAQDHLSDQPARAMSSAMKMAYANHPSLAMELYKPTDANQQWIVTKA